MCAVHGADCDPLVTKLQHLPHTLRAVAVHYSVHVWVCQKAVASKPLCCKDYMTLCS